MRAAAWRKRRDSNPCTACAVTAFRVRAVMTTSIRFHNICSISVKTQTVQRIALTTSPKYITPTCKKSQLFGGNKTNIVPTGYHDALYIRTQHHFGYFFKTKSSIDRQRRRLPAQRKIWTSYTITAPWTPLFSLWLQFAHYNPSFLQRSTQITFLLIKNAPHGKHLTFAVHFNFISF